MLKNIHEEISSAHDEYFRLGFHPTILDVNNKPDYVEGYLAIHASGLAVVTCYDGLPKIAHKWSDVPHFVDEAGAVTWIFASSANLSLELDGLDIQSFLEPQCGWNPHEPLLVVPPSDNLVWLRRLECPANALPKLPLEIRMQIDSKGHPSGPAEDSVYALARSSDFNRSNGQTS